MLLRSTAKVMVGEMVCGLRTPKCVASTHPCAISAQDASAGLRHRSGHSIHRPPSFSFSPNNRKSPMKNKAVRSYPRLGSSSDQENRGFTFPDLIAMVAVISLLLALHWPARGSSRGPTQTAVCLHNHRQLSIAWLMYAADNQDRLAGNLDGGAAQQSANTNRSWCVGWLDLSGSSQNTNLALLLNGQLGRYTRTAKVYKCPADPSLSRGLTGVPRARSVSMNAYVGERAQPYTGGFRQFKKLTEMTDPPPARAFVFIDEREDSINDPWFPIDMGSFDPANPDRDTIVDYPADWHNRGANLSFADGHVETWHWKDARTMPIHRPGQLLTLGVNSSNNSDVRRIQEACSRRVR